MIQKGDSTKHLQPVAAYAQPFTLPSQKRGKVIAAELFLISDLRDRAVQRQSARPRYTTAVSRVGQGMRTFKGPRHNFRQYRIHILGTDMPAHRAIAAQAPESKFIMFSSLRSQTAALLTTLTVSCVLHANTFFTPALSLQRHRRFS